MNRSQFAYCKNKRGMTLVEVIVSIALLGIISAFVVMIFSSGIMLALKSGDNTMVTGVASGAIENKLAGANLSSNIDGNLFVKTSIYGRGNYEETTVIAEVDFQNGKERDISGKLITVESNSDRNDTSIKAFIPN